MGLLGDLTAFIDNKKRVVARNIWDTLQNPADFQAQAAAQLREDLAPLRDLSNPEAAVRLALDMGAGPGMGVVGMTKKVGKTVNSPVFGRYDPTAIPAVPQSTPPRYIPPRGETPRIQSLLQNTSAEDQVLDWTQKGNTPDGIGWYNMEPLRKQFVKELGKKEGTAKFNQFIDLMAATSAGARTPENARIASYYFVEGQKGKPVPIPPKGSGYGHKAQNLHNASANDILANGGLDPFDNPKRFTFAENLKGNFDGVTVDKHNVRAWGMASRDPQWIGTKFEDPIGTGKPSWWDESVYGAFEPTKMNPQQFVIDNNIPWEKIPPTWFAGSPKKNEYAALEALNKRVAQRFGAAPAQTQAATWLGAGDITGLGSPPVSMIKTFEDVLQKRGKVRGQTPQEVLSEMIRGVRPLAVVPAATGFGLLDLPAQEAAPEY